MLIKNGYGLEHGCISLSAGYLSASTYRKYITVRTFFPHILLYLLCSIEIFWNLFFWDFFHAEKYALLCSSLLCFVMFYSTWISSFLLFSFPPHRFSFPLSSFLFSSLLLFFFSSFLLFVFEISKSVSQFWLFGTSYLLLSFIKLIYLIKYLNS